VNWPLLLLDEHGRPGHDSGFLTILDPFQRFNIPREGDASSTVTTACGLTGSSHLMSPFIRAPML